MIKFILNFPRYFSSRTKFQHACKAIHRYANTHEMPKLTYEEELQLYGLEKQSLEGDNMSKKDLSHLHGKTEDKYEAWEKCRGKRQNEAQEEYVTLVKNILKKHHAEYMIQDF